MRLFIRSLLTGAALLACASAGSAQAAWVETDLHDFSSDDGLGFQPALGVSTGIDGTTIYGSAFNSKLKPNDKPGDGVIFRYQGGKYAVIYKFDNPNEDCGKNPSAVLIQGPKGSLYGTTFLGGVGDNGHNGGGVIFKLTAPKSGTGMWTCQALYTFSKTAPASSSKGYNPFGGLVLVNNILYGTAQAGGKFGGGVAFSLDPNAPGSYTVLWSFSTLKPTENSKHNFQGGYTPAGRLVPGAAANEFYGATYFGGTHQGGVIYKLTTSGVYSVLHNFVYRPDQEIPSANGYQPSQNGLLFDSSTNTLYGETFRGGQIDGNPSDGGVAFKLTTSGAYSVIHVFDNIEVTTGGYNPIGGFTVDSNGDFIGVARAGGVGGSGAIFKMKKSGQNYHTLYGFSGSDGMAPNGPVSFDTQGLLFGTTFNGGAADGGVLFKLKNQP